MTDSRIIEYNAADRAAEQNRLKRQMMKLHRERQAAMAKVEMHMQKKMPSRFIGYTPCEKWEVKMPGGGAIGGEYEQADPPLQWMLPYVLLSLAVFANVALVVFASSW